MSGLSICHAQSTVRLSQNSISASQNYISEGALSARIFPLLTAISSDPDSRRLFAADPELKELTRQLWSAAAAAGSRCGQDHICTCETLVFNEQQTAKVSAALLRLYETEPQLRYFVKTKMQPTETFASRMDISPDALLVEGWQRTARAMDAVIATYCEGKAPRYPEIDSISYDPASQTYLKLIGTMLNGVSTGELRSDLDTAEEALFFTPTLRFAVRLLQANGRDEAARFAPLVSGENAAALKRLMAVNWSQYRYTAIVLLGAGPELPNVSLSPWGKERIRLGVADYRAGIAPFVLVSGGFVHPSRTPYCEALEMKRYLMQVYGIPEDAILIDPYARHTTTNLRNVSRELLSHAFPIDRPMLIVSDALQVRYVESSSFAQRNQQELGYQPVHLAKQVSQTSIEALPSRQSLLRDASDPLDP